MTKKIIYIIYTLILWGTTLGFAQGDKGNGGDQTTATRLLQAGDKFYDQRLYTASMKSYLDGLRIAEHQGYSELTARFYNGMGNLYSTQGDYQMGLYFYRKALRSSRKTGQKTLQNAVLNNLVGPRASSARPTAAWCFSSRWRPTWSTTVAIATIS